MEHSPHLTVLRRPACRFPLWVLLGAASALFKPEWFTWFCGDWIIWGLAVTSLSLFPFLSLSAFPYSAAGS